MLGDTIRATLPELQAHAESLMTSTCTITRVDPDGEPAWDEETGEYTDPLLTVYTGKCKVQTFQPYESEPGAGGAQRVVQRYHLHLPVSAGIFLVHDRATITASPNPNLVGNVYVVAAAHEKDYQTAQRILVDHDAGPS